ncbi:MAG: S8 family serine peptidase, partial [Chloroflexia bacterium]
GSGEPDEAEKDLFQALIDNGTTIVAAMGNERQYGSPTSYPAAIPGVIAVGATSVDDKVANFSNYGDHISISAPGVAIWSTLPTYPGQAEFEAVRGDGGGWVLGRPIPRDTDYAAWDGTSMATPHVTAAVALLIANQGGSDPQTVRDTLMKTADRVPAMGRHKFDPDYGAGRLNLLNLLQE